MTVHSIEMHRGHYPLEAFENGSDMTEALNAAAAAATSDAKAALAGVMTSDVAQAALIQNMGREALQVMMIGRPLAGSWATPVPAHIAAMPTEQQAFMAWKMSGTAPHVAMEIAEIKDAPTALRTEFAAWIEEAYRPSVVGGLALTGGAEGLEAIAVFSDASRRTAIAIYLNCSQPTAPVVAGCLVQSYEWMEARIMLDTPDLTGLRDLIRGSGSQNAGLSNGEEQRVVYGASEVVFSASKETVFRVV